MSNEIYQITIRLTPEMREELYRRASLRGFLLNRRYTLNMYLVDLVIEDFKNQFEIPEHLKHELYEDYNEEIADKLTTPCVDEKTLPKKFKDK